RGSRRSTWRCVRSSALRCRDRLYDAIRRLGRNDQVELLLHVMTLSALRDQVHPTRFRDLAVTVDFHCNSACTFCIVQEGMNNYRGVPFDRFARIVEENVRSRKYDRVIFTGGEVTLEKSLVQFVELARSSGAFRHVRLQTNGRKLAEAEYTRALVEAGLDEFFVSLHGDTAALHDRITQRPGSFDELIRGLD